MPRRVRKLWSKVIKKGEKDKKTSEVETTASNDTSILALKAQEDRNNARAPGTSANALSPVTGGQEPAPASASRVLSSVEAAEDEADYLGLFTFVEKGRDESGIVDIVAIHGLNGHYSKTWSTSSTKGGQINWLKDMLPERIPNARIMSFGYNATVQFSKSTAGISDFVEGLLSDLMSCRISREEKARPLIFICHSLGGIVFKQALVRARERDRYTGLLKHIRGVAFFGTPHSGSSSADFGNVLASILKASTLGISTNTTVVNDLKKNSQALFDITQSFVERGLALHIVTVYETEKMDFLNTQIVAKTSAVMSLPNETLVPIDGNHSTICKFSDSGAGKRSFIRVCSHLEEITRNLIQNEVSYPANLSQGQQLECFRGFYHKSYDSYRERNPDRVAGTCEWFLRHTKYREWKEKEASSLLWVSADPGCGKSVLAKFLVEFLRKENKVGKLRPEFVCHFFFKDDNDEQRSSLVALRALLHQMFSDDKALLRHAFPVFESKGPAMFEDFDSLWDIFSGIAKDPSATNLLVILDALDECEKNSQSQLLKHLNKLYHEKAPEKKPFFKVILLSRPENLIKYSLNQNIAAVRLRGEDQTGPLSEDVERVIRSHVDELSGQGLPHDLLSGLEKTLIKNADRTFLWTTLMIDLLKEAALSGASQKELEDLLDHDDIYAIYSKLLERSHGSNETEKLFQLILAAARPLTLDELNVALAVTPEQVSFKELKFNLKSSVESHLKNKCGHFIRIINSEVFLVHQTAREFLLQEHGIKRSSSFGIWHNRFSLDECHVTILQSCIYYLFLRIISTDAELKNESLALYASSFWSYHLASLTTIQAGLDVIVDIAIRSGARQSPHAERWFLAHNLIIHLDNWRFFLDDQLSTDGTDVKPQRVTLHFIPRGIGQTSSTPKTTLGHLQFKAIDDGLKALIINLLDGLGRDIKSTDNSGRTLLHYASAIGSPWLVSKLLQYGLDASALDNKHNTPLLSLAIGDKGKSGIKMEGERPFLYRRYEAVNVEAILEVLLSHGVEVDAVGEDGKTSMLLISERGLPKAIRILLSHGAKVDEKYSSQSTALTSAVECGSSDLIRHILRRNPDLSQVNDQGETAHDIMLRRPTFSEEIGAGLFYRPEGSERDDDVLETNQVYAGVFESDEEDSWFETSSDD